MIRRFLCVVAMLACGGLAASSSAFAQNRMALVIGNSAYQSVAKLANPAHDAQAVGQILNAAGFDVILARDLTRAGMEQTLQEFATNVTAKGKDAVALVFYAGHGLQVDGENFLVPVDARIQAETDVAGNTFALAEVMRALEAAPSSARIVILDACRNNPFTAIQKATGRGLAIVDAPDGSIVAYSTAPGFEALDGTGDDSPYTTALVQTISQPGLAIEQLFKEVRLKVHKETDGRQTPWESSSLTVNFAFFSGVVSATPPTPANANPPVPNNANLITPNNANPAAPNNPLTAPNRANPATPNNAAGPNNAPVANNTAVPLVPVAFTPPDEATLKSARLARIHTLPPTDAYDFVIEEDSIDAYEDFVQVYPTDPLCDRIRRILFRRQQMLAWRDATLTNTPDSYEAYITRYPYSDHNATANRLRVDPRPISIDPIIAPRNFPFPHFPGQFGQPGSFRPGQGGGFQQNNGFPGKGGGPNAGPTNNGPGVNLGNITHLPSNPINNNNNNNQSGNLGNLAHLPPNLLGNNPFGNNNKGPNNNNNPTNNNPTNTLGNINKGPTINNPSNNNPTNNNPTNNNPTNTLGNINKGPTINNPTINNPTNNNPTNTLGNITRLPPNPTLNNPTLNNPTLNNPTNNNPTNTLGNINKGPTINNPTLNNPTLNNPTNNNPTTTLGNITRLPANPTINTPPVLNQTNVLRAPTNPTLNNPATLNQTNVLRANPTNVPAITNFTPNKSPVVTTLAPVNHLPTVVDRLPQNNTPLNNTQFRPITNATPLRNTTPTNSFSQVGKAASPTFNAAPRNFGGGGGGGGNGGNGGRGNR